MEGTSTSSPKDDNPRSLLSHRANWNNIELVWKAMQALDTRLHGIFVRFTEHRPVVLN